MSKSGLLGVVNGQSTVRNWNLNQLANPKTFVASNTNTGTGARAGAFDFNGSFQAYGASPLILPGEAFTFRGYDEHDALEGKYWEGESIVDQLALVINFGTQEIISYTINFSGDGELTTGDGGGEDTTYPDAPPASSAVVSWGTADAVAAEIPDMTQVTITMTAANKAYVNSSTKINGKVWTRRKPGPKNWTASIARENSDGLSDTELGGYGNLTIVVDTASWAFDWATVGDNSNLSVNMESGDIIGLTHNLTMNIAPLGESTLGTVTTPAGLWLPA